MKRFENASKYGSVLFQSMEDQGLGRIEDETGRMAKPWKGRRKRKKFV